MKESKYVVVAYTKTKTNVLKALNLCIHEVKDEVQNVWVEKVVPVNRERKNEMVNGWTPGTEEFDSAWRDTDPIDRPIKCIVHTVKGTPI